MAKKTQNVVCKVVPRKHTRRQTKSARETDSRPIAASNATGDKDSSEASVPTSGKARQSIDQLKVPTIEQAIQWSGRVTGVSAECGIMPKRSEDDIRSLCRSIESVGQTTPIDLSPDGLLINGRHRLIACFMLGITPQFREVSPENVLGHVLSDMDQRQYNAAARAYIAIQIEELLNSRLKLLQQEQKDQILDHRRVKKDVTLPLDDGQTIELRKGSAIRDKSIELAKSTRSAVRRLKTLINQNAELAQAAIDGEKKLRDGERLIQSRRRKKSLLKKKSGRNGDLGKPLKGGKIEFVRENRSAILIPERTMNRRRAIRVLFDDSSHLVIKLVPSEERARELIENFLAGDPSA